MLLVQQERKLKKMQANAEKIDVLDKTIDEKENKIENLRNEGESENATEINNISIQLEALPLRERVKNIFKRYGFTVTAILLSVGLTIGVTVNLLTSGLKSVAKGVGNGLKDLGKKVAQILPGLIGSIVSFIFRTAGSVIGFLGENAWILILGVVIFAVEEFQKKK